MTYVYKITNTANGNFYIGSTVNAKARFRTHKRELRLGRHHCQPLQRAWAKYGEDSLVFEVIQHCETVEAMHDAENRWLAEHHGKPHCYNVGARAKAAFLGRTHSEAARRKMSEVNMGNTHRLGHKSSDDHCAKISAAMKGKPKSPEHVEKIRQRMIGTSYAKGRVVTDEERERRGRPIIELTTGLRFISVVEAAQHFGIGRPNLIRTLRNGGLVKRGPCKGLHFVQAVAPTET